MTTWGDPHTLHTWSGPRVADMAWRQRDAELRVLSAGAAVSPRAARERFDGHAEALAQALGPVPSQDPAVRHLAPHLSLAPALEP